jgi:hypothetical protein
MMLSTGKRKLEDVVVDTSEAMTGEAIADEVSVLATSVWPIISDENSAGCGSKDKGNTVRVSTDGRFFSLFYVSSVDRSAQQGAAFINEHIMDYFYECFQQVQTTALRGISSEIVSEALALLSSKVFAEAKHADVADSSINFCCVYIHTHEHESQFIACNVGGGYATLCRGGVAVPLTGHTPRSK